ncbi:hypothetical protein [uncultured Salegentibacter sp.]|uniref:hypothetical protein n=1 Tax=uncultured Salegentibacter sp. TaxID=259320 RepID=UPI00259927CD|nr:hypothetical protein [uncultured Salegentibacter sp.]
MILWGGKIRKQKLGEAKNTYGVFLTISNNLEFFGEAKAFLDREYALYKYQADVVLTKFIAHPITNEWQLAYTGKLNFSSRRIENKRFICDFVEGGLRELLNSQIREKHELNRKTDIKGNPISDLIKSKAVIEGRDIDLVSNWEAAKSKFEHYSGEWASVDEDRESFHPFPIQPRTNADPELNRSPSPTYELERRWELNPANMFRARSDRDRGRTTFQVDNLKFKVDSGDGNRVNKYNLKVVLRKYTSDDNGENLNLVEDLISIDLGDIPEVGQEFNLSIDKTEIEVSKNDSFAFGLYAVGQYGGGIVIISPGWLDVTYSDFSANITWAEDSFFRTTTTDFIRLKEVGSRLTEIYSGKPRFKSNFLDNDWRDLGLAAGGWIRNIEKVDEETGEKIEWPLTISWEDYFKTIEGISPAGYGIVNRGASQEIVLEDKRYFFQPYVTIKLPQLSNIKRKDATELIFTSYKHGFTEGGDYEKPLGLDEPNIQSDWINEITITEGKYEKLSPSRADSYAVEDARRLQGADYSERDSPYDNSNFLLDAKLEDKDVYRLRKWQDDFGVKPKGIYSPETAFNLRLSPANSLRRHAYWSTAAVKRGKIHYTSTEGNAQLKTKFPGKPAVKENQPEVDPTELSNPIFKTEWIEAELAFDQLIMDQIQGQTQINGEWLNNYYGLVEFINEQGLKERAWFFSAKIKDKFTFKLLSANL